MQSSIQPHAFEPQPLTTSRARLWTGRIITGLVTLFLLLDAIMKFVKPAPVIEAFARTGWPAELSGPLGAILMISTLLYAVPRTSLLGAVLLTGYLVGAVATNLRLENPLFSHTHPNPIAPAASAAPPASFKRPYQNCPDKTPCSNPPRARAALIGS